MLELCHNLKLQNITVTKMEIANVPTRQQLPSQAAELSQTA